LRDPARTVDRKVWRDGSLVQGSFGEGTRIVPEETAIALTYNGGTYAVMMATPRDLEDFAIGFSLGEGIIQSPDDVDSLDIVDLDDGVELRSNPGPTG
jgi:FdhD protein